MDIETSIQTSESSKKTRLQKRNTFVLHCFSCINYTPLQIQCFAYNPKNKILLLSRLNSIIEVREIQKYSILYTIRLQKALEIKKLIWINAEFFITIHLNGILNLFSLGQQKPTQKLIVSANALLDCEYDEKTNKIIVLSNQMIQAYTFNLDSKSLHLVQVLNNQSEILQTCCFLQESKNVIAAYNGPLLRIFDLNQKKTLKTIDLRQKADKNDIPWQIKRLQGNNIAVGTQQGKILIVETKFGSLLKEFHFHQGPVLAMVYSQGSLFATGADSRIISIKKIQNEWRITSKERGQSHDIFALEVIDRKWLLSGGITTDICIYDISSGCFKERELDGKKRKQLKLRHINPFPQERVCHLSKQNNLFLFRKSFSFEIWQFFPKIEDYRLLLRYDTKGRPVISTGITADGKYFAYSNLESCYIFQLDLKSVKVKKIKELPAMASLNFVKQNVLVAVDFDNNIHGYNILKKKLFTINTLSKTDFPVINISDVATNQRNFLFGSKFSNQVIIYDISTDDIVSFKVPQLIKDTYLVSAIFTPDGQQIFMQFSNRKFIFYNVKYNCLSKWSQKNINKFPMNYLKSYNFPIGAIFHPKNQKEIILYTNHDFTKVSYNFQPPRESVRLPATDPMKINFLMKNVKSSFQNQKLDRPILHMEVLDSGNIIAIEANWERIVSEFPYALNTKKYGN